MCFVKVSLHWLMVAMFEPMAIQIFSECWNKYYENIWEDGVYDSNAGGSTMYGFSSPSPCMVTASLILDPLGPHGQFRGLP